MARKNNLAALAALAGLGYALTSQSRNKVDLSEREDSNPSRGAGYNSTENRLKSQAQSIAEADKSSNATSMVNNEPSGTTTDGPAAPPNLDMPPAVNSPIVKPPAKVQGNNLAPIVSQKQLADFQQRFGKDKTLRDYRNAELASQNAPLKSVQLKKHGGAVKMASGGMTSSASRRGDGIATKGKTRGKIC
jgi:hypothetical protein